VISRVWEATIAEVAEPPIQFVSSYYISMISLIQCCRAFTLALARLSCFLLVVRSDHTTGSRNKPYGHDASRIVVRPISNFKGLPFGQ